MLVDENNHEGFEANRIPTTGRTTLAQRLDQGILGQFTGFVEFVCGADALDDPPHTVGIPIAASRQPNACTKVGALDLAMLSDPQRRPAGYQRAPDYAEELLLSLNRIPFQSITSLSRYRTCRPIFA